MFLGDTIFNAACMYEAISYSSEHTCLSRLIPTEYGNHQNDKVLLQCPSNLIGQYLHIAVYRTITL